MARRSGRRSDYEWATFGDVETAKAIGAEAQFGTTTITYTLAGTIMRVRGTVGVTLDTAAVDESAIICCGLMIVPQDLIVAGSAPEVYTGSSDDASWLWQGSLYVSSGAEASVVTDGLIADIEVDSKAMRRIKPNESLVFVHHSPAALASDQGGTYDLTYFFHVLKSL